MTQRLRSEHVLLEAPEGYRIAPATLVLEGARIAAVLPHEPAHPDDDDLGAHLLTPAFVDGHTHLALSFMRGASAERVRTNLVEDLYFHFESRLQPGDVRAFARMGAYECLLNGVGLVWDHYYEGIELAEALADVGLTGVVAPTLQDLAGPGKETWERGLRDTLTIAESAEFAARGVFSALGPHATDTVSPALFRRLAELAETHTLPVHLHLAQSLDEVRRVEAREGRSPLALLQREGVLERAPHVLMAHAIFTPLADLCTLDRARHTLAFCPSSQAQFALPASLPHFVRSGARWLVSNDCASSNDSFDLQKELRACLLMASAQVTYTHAFSAFVEGGDTRDAEEALTTRAESNAAMRGALAPDALLRRILSLPGEMHPRFTAGALRASALANVLAWDLSHPAFFPGRDVVRTLALGATSDALHAIWTAGVERGTRGDVKRSLLAGAQYREAHAEASARIKRLFDEA